MRFPRYLISAALEFARLDFLGSNLAFIGLMSLVKWHWEAVNSIRTLTYVFGGLCLAIWLLLFIITCACSDDDDGDGVSFFLFAIVLLVVPLYGDWVLGGIAHDLKGLPTKGNQIAFWTYWGSQWLFMFYI